MLTFFTIISAVGLSTCLCCLFYLRGIAEGRRLQEMARRDRLKRSPFRLAEFDPRKSLLPDSFFSAN